MPEAPNVIFITTDHLRYDNLGANGNANMVTPVLDGLARAGVSLDRLYVQNPVCMASRASIWTGRYPQNHGGTANGVPLSKDEPNMTRAFYEAGYRTVNVGKLHFQNHEPARTAAQNAEVYAGYGYETNLLSDEPGCYDDDYIEWVKRVAPQHVEAVRVPMPGDRCGHNDRWPLNAPEWVSHPAWITEQAIEFINDHPGDRPLFMTLGYYNPHPPMNPPQAFLDLYNPASLPMPVQAQDVQGISGEAWREVKQYFYAMVSHVDACVGRVLDTLHEAGMERNTIVVFTSDHGDSLGDFGHLGKGPWNHEEVLRVPGIVRWPGGLPAKRRVGPLMESIDLFPTLATLCGVEVPYGVKGRDCAGLWRGETEAGRASALTEFKMNRRGLSVKTLRTDRYKYTRRNDKSETLCDFERPQAEAENLADVPQYAPILGNMRQALLDRLIDAEDDLPQPTHRY